MVRFTSIGDHDVSIPGADKLAVTVSRTADFLVVNNATKFTT